MVSLVLNNGGRTNRPFPAKSGQLERRLAGASANKTQRDWLPPFPAPDALVYLGTSKKRLLCQNQPIAKGLTVLATIF
jgi:hypothetical protein